MTANNESYKETVIDSNGTLVVIYRNEYADADELCEKLKNEVPWEQHEVRMPQGMVMQPRRIYACGEAGMKHVYSGLTLPLNPWIPEVKSIRDYLAGCFNIPFNACLLNEYTDGLSSIGYHSDKELAMPVVATVSLGGPRDFYIRPKYGGDTIKLQLFSGDIMLMLGKCQEHYLHSIPKRQHANYRISLTYRVL